MFDAYTVKKVLPRLFIAVILIQLSWFIFTGMIQITNSIAIGIESLIYAPFDGIDQLQLQNILSASNGGNGLFIGLTFAVAAGGILAALAVGGIMTTALIALLGVLIAFALLLARQIIIVALLLISPLAIVAWILPGTEKYWKMWWESFFKLLLVFPMIMALIATGRVLAVVVADVDPASGAVPAFGDDIITFFLLIACIFGPFYMIPKTFQLAGGIFQTLTGTINNKSRGAFDRLRNRRKQTQAKNWENTMNNRRFQGGNERNFRGLMNRSLQRGSMVASGAAGLNAARWAERTRTGSTTAAEQEMRELTEKNADIQAVLPDDHLAEATQFGRGREDIIRMLRNSRNLDGSASRWATASDAELSDAAALVEKAQKAGSVTAVNSAMALARASSGTGYNTSSDMYESIIQAAGGDRRLEGALLAKARSASESARRPDLAAAGHVEQAGQLDRIRETIGLGEDSVEHQARRAEVNANVRAASLREAGAHGVLNGRSQSVEQHLQQLSADYIAARDSGDIATATNLAAEIHSFRSASASANPRAKEQVAQMLQRVGIDTTSRQTSDEQLGLQIAVRYAETAGLPPDREELDNLQTQAIQEIRTRAGSYEYGTRGVDPRVAEASGQQPEQP